MVKQSLNLRDIMVPSNSISSRCLDLILREQKKNVGKILPDATIRRFRNYIKEAQEIWVAAVDTFNSIEKQTGTPYRLKIKPQLYAVDGIVFADLLGMPKEKRSAALQAFSIYYLSVHLVDDLIEDPIKFCSKFLPTGNEDQKLRTSAVSFILHASMAFRLLISKSEKNIMIEKFSQKFTASLAAQIKYFLLEKSNDISPKGVLKIKQRCVSGEATSFIADCLQLDSIYNGKHYGHIKKGLTYLGSLTQFTDDLRDYEEDKRNNNANLLVSMEKFFGKEAINTFIKWYLKEEQFMLKEFERAGLKMNCDLICAIPWFPFFMKTFIIKHLFDRKPALLIVSP